MRPGGAVAAIDCGTNSTRLFVTDPYGAPLERQMRITRLGEGVDETGMLSPEAIDRCLSVLRDYRKLMDRYQVRRGRVVATSAARDASNGEDFLGPAAEVTGYPVEVLTGVEEGRLSLTGALSDLDNAEGPFLVLDIGGGSTELVAGTGPEDPELEVDSLQIGCVRVTERYLGSDPPTASELLSAESAVSKELDEAVSEHPRLLGASPPDRPRRNHHHTRRAPAGTDRLRERPDPSFDPDGDRRDGLVPDPRIGGPFGTARPRGDGPWPRGRDRRGCDDPRRGHDPSRFR